MWLVGRWLVVLIGGYLVVGCLVQIFHAGSGLEGNVTQLPLHGRLHPGRDLSGQPGGPPDLPAAGLAQVCVCMRACMCVRVCVQVVVVAGFYVFVQIGVGMWRLNSPCSCARSFSYESRTRRLGIKST